MKSNTKLKQLICSLEEIKENCLDNIEYEDFHKEQLSNAEIALEGFIELQNTVDKLEEAGVKVEEDIASSLYHLASPKIDKDPIMKITFESFGDKGNNFKGFIEERINALKEFILRK